MGPEGGEEGGHVMAAGTPEEVAAVEGSYTGQFLGQLVEPAAPAKKRPRASARWPRPPERLSGSPRLLDKRGTTRCCRRRPEPRRLSGEDEPMDFDPGPPAAGPPGRGRQLGRAAGSDLRHTPVWRAPRDQP